jgi:hypothetical protein
MSKRTPISKKLRFEVFKRDKFTCQYCGSKAPDVVLHVDHLHPVAKGGKNDILNLVTACEGCNSGKGARLIDDASVVERQRAQMEILEARREQLQMMLEWRDELERVKTDTVAMIADRIGERGEFVPNENGLSWIRKWLKKYSFDEVLAAVDEAFDIYMQWVGNEADQGAWEKAFKKIPAICSIRRQSAEKPYIQKLCYTQGILRRRLRDKRGKYVQALEEMILEWGATEGMLEEAAKRCSDWDDFNDIVIAACRSARSAERSDV